jgi:hypothetical protein
VGFVELHPENIQRARKANSIVFNCPPRSTAGQIRSRLNKRVCLKFYQQQKKVKPLPLPGPTFEIPENHRSIVCKFIPGPTGHGDQRRQASFLGKSGDVHVDDDVVQVTELTSVRESRTALRSSSESDCAIGSASRPVGFCDPIADGQPYLVQKRQEQIASPLHICEEPLFPCRAEKGGGVQFRPVFRCITDRACAKAFGTFRADAECFLTFRNR